MGERKEEVMLFLLISFYCYFETLTPTGLEGSFLDHNLTTKRVKKHLKDREGIKSKAPPMP